jgi:hypothetical protein
LRTRYQRDPDDETERQIRILRVFLWIKARKSTFGEIATFGTNCVLIFIGIIAASIYGCQLHQMTIATQAATSSANTARDSLNLANRPWIKVVSVTTRDNPGSPALRVMHYGSNNTWVDLTVVVTVENLGPSVATNTNIAITPFTPDIDQHGKDTLAAETLICANDRKTEEAKTGRNVAGITIFPKDPFEDPHAGSIFAINPKRILHQQPPFSDPAGYFPLSVIGCITYQSAVSQNVYQTGFIYDVGANDKGVKGFNGIIPMGADLVAQDLRFDKEEAGYFAQ